MALTLTFGDVAENHVGMQKIGNLAEQGFTIQHLLHVKEYFDALNVETKIIHLNTPGIKADDAYVLIIKNGVNSLLNDPNGANHLFDEQNLLEKDT